MFKYIFLVLALLFSTAAEATPVRTYVIYGQGGAITSGGMVSLASRLKKYRNVVVSTHEWKYPGVIVNSIRRLPANEPVIVIGYSLGANDTTWITNNLPNRRFALVIAYDPSQYGYIYPIGQNVDKFIQYHNTGTFGFGHAIIPGKSQVISINSTHLLIDYNQSLHARTISEVRAVRDANK